MFFYFYSWLFSVFGSAASSIILHYNCTITSYTMKKTSKWVYFSRWKSPSPAPCRYLHTYVSLADTCSNGKPMMYPLGPLLKDRLFFFSSGLVVIPARFIRVEKNEQRWGAVQISRSLDTWWQMASCATYRNKSGSSPLLLHHVAFFCEQCLRFMNSTSSELCPSPASTICSLPCPISGLRSGAMFGQKG